LVVVDEALGIGEGADIKEVGEYAVGQEK